MRTWYVDLTSAYDHIITDLLFSSITKRCRSSESTESIDLIKEIYRFTKSGEDHNTETCQTLPGVRQGGNDSPVQFNLFLEYALSIFKYRCEEIGTDPFGAHSEEEGLGKSVTDRTD